MICAKCGKDKKSVDTHIPGISGLVCANCRIHWRLENEPGCAEAVRVNKARYQTRHSEEIVVYNAERHLRHKVEANAKSAKWRLDHPEQNRLLQLNWRKSNRDYTKKRYATDIQFKLAMVLRSRQRMALKTDQKVGSAVRDLGCTVGELKAYLESKFQPGMAWQNWGVGAGKWNIDHVRPLVSFDLTDRQQFLQAYRYSNLQPLWSIDNLSKHDKWDGVI